MRHIYNLIQWTRFAASAPARLLKRWTHHDLWREEYRQLIGDYDSKVKHAVTNRHVLLLHAVTPDQVNLCTHLIAVLEARVPNLKMIISTSSAAGLAELQAKLPSHVIKIYEPADRPEFVMRALKTLHPRGIVLLAPNLRPNFLWRAGEMHLPVFLVNAVPSERACRRFRSFGSLFRPLFSEVHAAACQNDADANRLVELGCRPEAVHVVGNLKFEAAKIDEHRPLDVPTLLHQLGVTPEEPVLLGAGTHSGEEAVLAEVFVRLKKRFPRLFLVLVPRQFERGKEVGRALESSGVSFAYRKDITSQSRFKERQIDCLVVNTDGELRNFYRSATIVFLGKSLTVEGGQDPVEPGALARPLVFGPNMQDFAPIAQALVERGGAMRVRSASDLETVLGELLADPARAANLGRNAQTTIREGHGGVERVVALIISRLKSSVYMADLSEPGVPEGESNP